MSTVNPTDDVTQAQLNAHTEQALVELVYIQEANNLIGLAMGNLDSALNTTQSVLNILQALQNLHNDISVQAKSAFPFDYSYGSALIATLTGPPIAQPFGTVKHGTPVITTKMMPKMTILQLQTLGSNPATQYEAIYNKLASAYFGTPIEPNFVFSSMNAPGYAAFENELSTLKEKLRLEISTLYKQTPSTARTDPTSLLDALQKVYRDMPSNFSFSTVEKWALDNYNYNTSTLIQAANAGSIENDLTTAITAAQSLNDTQKENVRRFLFIFQEYYQSASAILSSITQVIEMMAQKISS